MGIEISQKNLNPHLKLLSTKRNIIYNKSIIKDILDNKQATLMWLHQIRLLSCHIMFIWTNMVSLEKQETNLNQTKSIISSAPSFFFSLGKDFVLISFLSFWLGKALSGFNWYKLQDQANFLLKI